MVTHFAPTAAETNNVVDPKSLRHTSRINTNLKRHWEHYKGLQS